MGTNYYAHYNTCPHCGRSDDPKHIGKSSAGWCFALHVYPEDNIQSLDDWIRAWDNAVIRDEYGDSITTDDLLKVITKRQRNNGLNAVPIGYSSWVQFHNLNESTDGPNGLVRHRLNERCVGHGDGTWDYLVGEFS